MAASVKNFLPCLIMILSFPLCAGAVALSDSNGPARHGWLKVSGARLVDENAETVQLRGMSSHGLTWFPLYLNTGAFVSLKERGANLFRAAMYTQGYNYGYSQDDTARLYNKAMLFLAVENALAFDMYVIADWHVLEEKNPLYLADSAMAFFDELSARYAHNPNVLYEICNEPNGETTWEDIKAYAAKIVPVIRKNSPSAIILVGTPNYCQELFRAVREPLPFQNIMYTFHFYTGMTGYDYKPALEEALSANIPVFVSEWGLSRDNATGKLNVDKAYEFIAYAKERRISWANWSLSNASEDYSAIRADVAKLSGWSDDDLSPSGKIIFNSFRD